MSTAATALLALGPPSGALLAASESAGPSFAIASAGDALWIAVPLALGVLVGWFGRRAIFGTTVTAIGVVGFVVTWYLATHDVGFSTEGGGDSFDALGDALLAVMVYVSLLLAFGLVGLLGFGAIVGAFLRSAATGGPNVQGDGPRGPGDAEPPPTAASPMTPDAARRTGSSRPGP